MKKKNYLIGAQWLRTGREEETAMEGGAISQTSSGGQGVNASKIMDVDGDVSGVNGSVSIPVNESQSINAKISMESVQAGGDKINKEIPYMHATDCLLDTKKRRMEDIMGKRIGQLGRFALCLWTFLCLPPPDSFYSYSYSSDGDSDDSSTTVDYDDFYYHSHSD
ncbi:hypothetical protein F8388_000620 [Cannabis sativa]|uniref:Uncharacterized protein n=1 Tax=Cannabis sativa TaxID=3483 RepID=A0A7J6DY56_CANSA|nr:hypothetical protein G4B88_003303 [Cannabis sativa]KAF4381926.1 hypothetical protein F8388_000620 [Cannabis sativa]